MPRYKCIVEYESIGIAGWQKQSHMPSVQEYIENALYGFLGKKTEVISAGRTDAGVHSIGQVIHFDIGKEFPPYKVVAAVNFYLKKYPVSIINAEIVEDAFHARFFAKKRHYKYIIISRIAPLVLDKYRAWHVPVSLDIENMREASSYLFGQHDFTSFRDSACQAKNPVKTIDCINIISNGNNIEIHISANSFLHHMVRNIVGTLKLVGEGRLAPADVKSILLAKDRTKAGPTAPAFGLYLVKVDY